MKITTYNNQSIDADITPASGASLVALPGLIDPHVHFRVPGAEHKEDWITGSAAALAGGVTTVIDMPNNTPPVIDYASLMSKKKIVDEQIAPSGHALRYFFYLGATPTNWIEFEKCQREVIGIKLFMGASTGDLLVDKLSDQERIFAEAARLDMLVAVHAEDDATIKAQHLSSRANPPAGGGVEGSVATHSQLRPRSAAIIAVQKAIMLAEKYGTRLYICHVSTSDEIDLIRAAKTRGVKVFCEVAPHHLFFNQSAYETLGAKVQMNPPLRTAEDQTALWQAIADGTVDTIGTDHAPHTLTEKAKIYPATPSGVPGVENYLALLLNAHNQGKITIEKIVALTHDNPQSIFRLPEINDWVVVDLNQEKTVRDEDQKTKCGWSPYSGMKLKGWPLAIVSITK
ncbi:MAG: dihydroorotase [Candidatus Magasanikbacteria bacterium]